jgi:ATP-dependent Clp endopeptidase proteolytic subunit ClpP
VNDHRARVQQAQQQYRFRGQLPPAQREPIKAEVTAKNNGTVATLRIFDVIDSWGGPFGVSAKEVAAALDEMGPSVTEIDLHLNSPGGEALEGIAILNLLRAHPARVTATVDGMAASAASFLAVGADETIMARNSQMMIHDAWGLVVGNATDMRELAGVLDKLSDNIASIYAEKAGGTTEQWRGAMQAETWYLADEAVTAGLADSVIAAEEPAPAPANAFDLSVFAHSGRQDAPDPFIPAASGAPESPAPAGNSPVSARHHAEIAEAQALLAVS